MTPDIITSVLPATDTLGTRFRAKCAGRQTTLPRDYALDVGEMHRKVAEVLADRLGMAFPERTIPTLKGYIFTGPESAQEFQVRLCAENDGDAYRADSPEMAVRNAVRTLAEMRESGVCFLSWAERFRILAYLRHRWFR